MRLDVLRLSRGAFENMGLYSGESWMRSHLGSWSGGRPEGISVESVLRELEAGISVLRKGFWFEIFLLRLDGSWKWMFAVLKGLARPGGRPEGISVTSGRGIFEREAVSLGRKGILLRGNDKEEGESGGSVEARGSVFRLFES